MYTTAVSIHISKFIRIDKTSENFYAFKKPSSVPYAVSVLTGKLLICEKVGMSVR